MKRQRLGIMKRQRLALKAWNDVPASISEIRSLWRSRKELKAQLRITQKEQRKKALVFIDITY